MRLKSLARIGFDFQVIEVELTLLRGLPTVQILGLPDTLIKESSHRLKAALVAKGFNWPRARRLIFNLRPTSLRKSSQGIDLAMAVALLLETQQIAMREAENLIYYGELGLDGSIRAPVDLLFLPRELMAKVVSGPAENWRRDLGFEVDSLSQLAELKSLGEGASAAPLFTPPSLTPRKFSSKAARLLMVAASGEHSLFIGGPAGSGKSTFVESLYQLLGEPNPESFFEAQRMALMRAETLTWRPLVSPHHSTPPLSMLGGGVPVVPGEFTRAHSGMLFLDEYLEFNPRVQEALREPLERGEIHISRQGEYRRYPAQFMAVAATNLCPCGSLVPNRSTNCGLTLARCQSVVARLRGPVLDRFDIFSYSHRWQGERGLAVEEIKKTVDRAIEFRLARGQSTPNGRLDMAALSELTGQFLLERALPEGDISERRKRALLRLARTLADLEESEKVGFSHLSEAREFGFRPFMELSQLFA